LIFDSGATLLDWGAHTVDLCQWANQADTTTPVSYEPDGGTICAEYANGVKLVMRPVDWRGRGYGTCPVRFEGDQGRVEMDVMRNSHIACHAAAIAWQPGRKVTFNPVKEAFIGDEEANRMRTRAKRAPWHI